MFQIPPEINIAQFFSELFVFATPFVLLGFITTCFVLLTKLLRRIGYMIFIISIFLFSQSSYASWIDCEAITPALPCPEISSIPTTGLDSSLVGCSGDGICTQATAPTRYEGGEYWCIFPTGGAWSWTNTDATRYPCGYQYTSCTSYGFSALVYLCKRPQCTWYCKDTSTNTISNTSVSCSDAAPGPLKGAADACPAGKDYVGGCNGTPKFCEGSATYESAKNWILNYKNIREWVYYTSVTPSGQIYHCMDMYKNEAGGIVLSMNGPLNQVFDPSASSACLTQAAHIALNNTVCDAAGNTMSVGGKNSNFYTNNSTGNYIKLVNGVYVNDDSPPSASTTLDDGSIVTQTPSTGAASITSPGGVSVPVTSNPAGNVIRAEIAVIGTGGTSGVPSPGTSGSVPLSTIKPSIDSNKDGFDDVTGKPSFTNSSGENYQLTNNSSAPNYDTQVDTPQKSGLSSLFGKAVNPLKTFISGTRLTVSNSFCSQTVPLWRGSYTVDLCPYQSVLSTFGSFLLVAASIFSVFLVFK